MSGGVSRSILLVSPAPTDSVTGNGVTARRWRDILRGLGHDVRIAQSYDGAEYDLLIALHAVKSASAVRAFHLASPRAPVVLALTGTDLYPDLGTTGVPSDVLQIASRIVVLQPLGLDQLDPTTRLRARVIRQSLPVLAPGRPREDCFEVAFLAHLRPVKDPLRLAVAVRDLPPESRIQVTHAGAGHDRGLAAECATESARNPRYTWLGPLVRERALALLARSRLLAVTSWHEGGANVVSEALAAGVPVVASAIPGSIGLLGEEYPGYFPPGDATALAALLVAAERDDDGMYHKLQSQCVSLRELVDPTREVSAWAELLTELELPVSI
jgi:putative glycosyltransferase (TIGR04348 family)